MDLLSADDPKVEKVLEVLHDEQALNRILETSRKRIFHLIASIAGMQVETEGLLIPQVINNIKQGVLDAVIIQTAMSGKVPSGRHIGGAYELAWNCFRLEEIPAFLVRDAPIPQRKFDYQTLLENYGCISLENAFSGETDKVVKVIHGAFNSTDDKKIAASAVYSYYKQTKYPPRGWIVQPSTMVRM